MSSINSNKNEILSRIEFHRKSMALLPLPDDKNPGVSFLIFNEDEPNGKFICSCMLLKEGSCSHMQELKKIFDSLSEHNPDTLFRNGIWYKIASILIEGNKTELGNTGIKKLSLETGNIIRVTDSKNSELARFFYTDKDTARFVERCIGKPQNIDGESIPARNVILSNLYHQSMTKNEWLMLEQGVKTRGQMQEESFWFRLAYHAYMEFGNESFKLNPGIDNKTGLFTVTCVNRDSIPVFRINVPRRVVKKLITALKDLLPNQHGLPIQPVPLKSIFNITKDTELDLDLRTDIEQLQKKGEAFFLKQKDFEHYKYDDLVYIPDLEILAELEKPGKERKFRAPLKMNLKKSQVSGFIDDHDHIDETSAVTQDIKAIEVFKEYESIEIIPEAFDREGCSVSVKYSFGKNEVSLNNILKAAKDGQRYIETDSGWVDTRSPSILNITDLLKDIDPEADPEILKLSRMDLVRFNTFSSNVNVAGDNKAYRDLLKKFLDLKPSKPVSAPEGLKSELREYQKLGLNWLHYLSENFFGGLLCDDMGLGKTHQVMAFLLSMMEQQNIEGPFLVICPTTVLSHWKAKISDHAPSLKGFIYHGGDRNFSKALKKGKLILTSYGILTRDIEKIKKVSFPVTVFDEVQHIKNKHTQAYHAAEDIDSEMKIGLTGTPIENRLEELKALFDLTLPGYLGTDRDFSLKYVKPVQDQGNTDMQEELADVISPFILRRLKTSVLHELPEKIEDILSCPLSDDQLKLYKNAVKQQGTGLLNTLKNDSQPVPYIHVFALLNYLKQICNHPALVEKSIMNYEDYESGKWELFKEILNESIDNGQKVVVYSQYLDMIDIMERHLKKQGTGFVSLTGKSTNRGSIIKKFSDDENCRVFIGSLKAGGVGIDLVAASVVIHYDRWWNAAKEDQATDRVHRFGQKRGVQVFKLVTEGTLEEKISAIISQKRDLMESVVREDDPGLLKSFSREQLIDLINF